MNVVELGVRLLSAMKCDPPVSRLPSPIDSSAEVFDYTVRADTVKRRWVSVGDRSSSRDGQVNEGERWSE